MALPPSIPTGPVTPAFISPGFDANTYAGDFFEYIQDNAIVSVYHDKAASKYLMYRMDGTFLSLPAGGSSIVPFDGNRAITANIPGLTGVNLGGTTITEVLEAFVRFMYPALGPVADINVADGLRERGNQLGINFTWTVTKKTDFIGKIVVNSVDQPATGGTQSGSGTVTFAQGPTVTIASADVNGLTSNDFSTVSYSHKRFWFASGTDLLGATDATISAAVTAANSEFSESRQQSRTFTLADEYVYFAYTAGAGDATFKVFSLSNTAYQLRTFSYTNSQGLASSFRLYRSGGKGTGFIDVQIN